MKACTVVFTTSIMILSSMVIAITEELTPHMPILHLLHDWRNYGSHQILTEPTNLFRSKEGNRRTSPEGPSVNHKQRSYSGASPQGIPFNVPYVGDENGFDPVAPHVAHARDGDSHASRNILPLSPSWLNSNRWKALLPGL